MGRGGLAKARRGPGVGAIRGRGCGGGGAGCGCAGQRGQGCCGRGRSGARLRRALRRQPRRPARSRAAPIRRDVTLTSSPTHARPASKHVGLAHPPIVRRCRKPLNTETPATPMHVRGPRLMPWAGSSLRTSVRKAAVGNKNRGGQPHRPPPLRACFGCFASLCSFSFASLLVQMNGCKQILHCYGRQAKAKRRVNRGAGGLSAPEARLDSHRRLVLLQLRALRRSVR